MGSRVSLHLTLVSKKTTKDSARQQLLQFSTAGFVVLFLCLTPPLASSAQTFTTLVNFDSTHGAGPDAGLVQGRDGNLYGTASSGGANGNGIVFKMTPEGEIGVLHSFDGTDGDYPQASLLLNSDGNFYGTTYDGGTHFYNSYGTIFRISATGGFASLFSFDLTDGASPTAALVQGADGACYGTTYGSFGTVFRMTPTFRTAASGRIVTLYGLPPEFIDPFAGLVLGNDDNFYGTGYFAGANSDGEVFQITPSGILTVLHSFDQADGRWPTSTLALGNDGNFYGTTLSGGANDYGTVYKITSSGTFTTLHSFAPADGEYPQGPLVLGSDGNFYGTTVSGGANMHGTLYELMPDGAITVLHDFDGTDGSSPTAGLVQHTDGKFYGATYAGGIQGYGTVFSLDLGLSPLVGFLPVPGNVGETVGLFGEGFNGTTSVFFNGIPAQFNVLSDTYLAAVVPAYATTGFVTVTTPTRPLTSSRPFRIQ